MEQRRQMRTGVRYSFLLIGVLFLTSCTSLLQHSYTTFVSYKPVNPSDIPGFEWKEQACIDYVLYSYVPQNIQEPPYPQGFGVYIGEYPNFEKGTAKAQVYKKFAGRHVTWYRRTENQAGKMIQVWETLIKIHPKAHYYPTYVHAWIYAEQESEMLRFLNWAETLEFEVISEHTFE